MKLKGYAYLIKIALLMLTMPVLVNATCPSTCPDIGSDTNVCIYNTPVTLVDGCRIAGFASVQGGFSLTDATVNATFDSVFPVLGPIDLSGGNLILSQDLILRNGTQNASISDATQIVTFGDISGDGHVVQFAPSMSLIPTTALDAMFTFSNVQLFLNSDIQLEGTQILFTGTNVINGQGNMLSLISSTTLQVGSNSSLLIKNVIIDNLSAQSLQCFDNTGVITFENAELYLSNDYSFTKGSFDVINQLTISGNSNTFEYLSTQTSTIQAESTLLINTGVTFLYEPTSNNPGLLQFATTNSELMLMNGSLQAGVGNLMLTGGMFTVGGHSYLSGNFLLGNGGLQDLTITILPAAVLDLLIGTVTYINS